jgi:plastocyanin
MRSTTSARVGALLATALIGSVFLVLGAAPAHAAHHTVTMQGYAYGPAALTITQGDTVTWVNKDQAPHDVVVTSGPQSFRSPLLEKGESWSFTFATAGTWAYTCSVHPDMKASVTAKAAPRPEPEPAPAAPTTHAHTSAPAASASEPATAPRATPKKLRPTAPAPATTPAPTQVASTPGDAALNPLLLVAGVAIAVVVFCLLMLASRPVVQPVDTES